jgi:hypothetical protein
MSKLQQIRGFTAKGLRVFDGKALPLFFAVLGCFVRRLLEVSWKSHPPLVCVLNPCFRCERLRMYILYGFYLIISSYKKSVTSRGYAFLMFYMLLLNSMGEYTDWTLYGHQNQTPPGTRVPDRTPLLPHKIFNETRISFTSLNALY